MTFNAMIRVAEPGAGVPAAVSLQGALQMWWLQMATASLGLPMLGLTTLSALRDTQLWVLLGSTCATMSARRTRTSMTSTAPAPVAVHGVGAQNALCNPGVLQM